MRQISRERFDALAGYARGYLMSVLAREIGWFEVANEAIVAAVFVDTDDEYSAVVLARDLRERFRAIGVLGPYETPEEAIRYLRVELSHAARELEKIRGQGDEVGVPVDFFTPVVPAERLHRGFTLLTTQRGFRAARKLIGEMMRWYEDVDGNFVEQLQTTGFDARLWELYLYATLVEAGFEVERPTPAPDFLAHGLGGEIAIEATTVNATQGPDGRSAASQRPGADGDVNSYLLHYLPIKFAGPLTAKLRKQYWRYPAAADKPFILAIQDFHDTMSMTYSGSALAIYLYGYQNEAETNSDGSLSVTSIPIKEHVWGTKVVPSGFFSHQTAEYVSAVIFNGTATLSKFNRMGVKVGFGSDDVVLVRHVTAIDPRPNAREPIKFVNTVSEGNPETWIEGTNVYHNPNAVHRLDPELFQGAAHHYLESDGRLRSVMPQWHPMSSQTSVLTLTDNAQTGKD